VAKKTIFFNNCVGIFQGGGCRAAAYVGAYKEASERGISFSSLAGTSAGALVVALIGAGAKADKLEEIISQVDFIGFLEDPDDIPRETGLWAKAILSLPQVNNYKPVVTRLGLHSSRRLQVWLESQLADLLPSIQGPVKFKHLPIPTTVVATDLKAQRIKLWSTEATPEEDVAYAVRASCSIPFFFRI
jgi:predicted acylesterase/phospholipase RssA